MANSLKGEVPLTLSDGRDLLLVFDMEALIAAEDEYGKPLPVLVQRVSEGFFGALRVMFWAAMQRHHPGTTLEDVNDILTTDQDAIEKALAAYKAAMPKPAEGKEGANPRSKTQRGKNSGRNGARRA